MDQSWQMNLLSSSIYVSSATSMIEFTSNVSALHRALRFRIVVNYTFGSYIVAHFGTAIETPASTKIGTFASAHRCGSWRRSDFRFVNPSSWSIFVDRPDQRSDYNYLSERTIRSVDNRVVTLGREGGGGSHGARIRSPSEVGSLR